MLPAVRHGRPSNALLPARYLSPKLTTSSVNVELVEDDSMANPSACEQTASPIARLNFDCGSDLQDTCHASKFGLLKDESDEEGTMTADENCDEVAMHEENGDSDATIPEYPVPKKRKLSGVRVKQEVVSDDVCSSDLIVLEKARDVDYPLTKAGRLSCEKTENIQTAVSENECPLIESFETDQTVKVSKNTAAQNILMTEQNLVDNSSFHYENTDSVVRLHLPSTMVCDNFNGNECMDSVVSTHETPALVPTDVSSSLTCSSDKTFNTSVLKYFNVTREYDTKELSEALLNLTIKYPKSPQNIFYRNSDGSSISNPRCREEGNAQQEETSSSSEDGIALLISEFIKTVRSTSSIPGFSKSSVKRLNEVCSSGQSPERTTFSNLSSSASRTCFTPLANVIMPNAISENNPDNDRTTPSCTKANISNSSLVNGEVHTVAFEPFTNVVPSKKELLSIIKNASIFSNMSLSAPVETNTSVEIICKSNCDPPEIEEIVLDDLSAVSTPTRAIQTTLEVIAEEVELLTIKKKNNSSRQNVKKTSDSPGTDSVCGKERMLKNNHSPQQNTESRMIKVETDVENKCPIKTNQKISDNALQVSKRKVKLISRGGVSRKIKISPDAYSSKRVSNDSPAALNTLGRSQLGSAKTVEDRVSLNSVPKGPSLSVNVIQDQNRNSSNLEHLKKSSITVIREKTKNTQKVSERKVKFASGPDLTQIVRISSNTYLSKNVSNDSSAALNTLSHSKLPNSKTVEDRVSLNSIPKGPCSTVNVTKDQNMSPSNLEHRKQYNPRNYPVIQKISKNAQKVPETKIKLTSERNLAQKIKISPDACLSKNVSISCSAAKTIVSHRPASLNSDPKGPRSSGNAVLAKDRNMISPKLECPDGPVCKRRRRQDTDDNSGRTGCKLTRLDEETGLVFAKRRGYHRAYTEDLRRQVGKALIRSKDVPLLILEWNGDWLLTQRATKKFAPILEVHNPVKNSYESILDYYNTYFPLHLLSIWLRITDSWENHSASFEALFHGQEQKPDLVKITCDTVLRVNDQWPRGEDILLLRIVKVGGKEENHFGLVSQVMTREYVPPKNSSLPLKERHSLKMVRFECYCAESFQVSPQEKKIGVKILCNIRTMLLQNDALMANNATKRVILDPDSHRSEWGLIKLPSSSDHAFHRCVRKIVESATSPRILVTVVDISLPCDQVLTTTQVTKELLRKRSSVLIGTRSRDLFLRLAATLKSCNPVLAVRKRDVNIPDEFREFTLEERLEKVNHAREIFGECHVTLTILKNIYLKDFRDTKQSVTCILPEANHFTETDSALLLHYNSKNLILMGKNEICNDMHPLLAHYTYNLSLYHRFLNLR